MKKLLLAFLIGWPTLALATGNIDFSSATVNGTLPAANGISRSAPAKTSAYTITLGDFQAGNTILADTAAVGAFSLTLPDPSTVTALYVFVEDKKQNFGTANLTLARHASEKINGTAANFVITTTGYFGAITTDGTDWYVTPNTSSGSGTVTSVSGNNGLTGTVTTSGNIGLASIADQRLLGNVSGGSAVPIALTAAQISTFLSLGSLATLNTVNNSNWSGTGLSNANLANSSVSVSGTSGLTGGGSVSLGGSTTISLDTASANTFTAVQTVNKGGIHTTDTAGLIIANDTASTVSNTVEQSPYQEFHAGAWKSNATAADQRDYWRVFVLPATGATVTTSKMEWLSSINSTSSFTDQMELGSDGSLNLANGGVFKISGTQVMSSSALGTAVKVDVANGTTGRLAYANLAQGSAQSVLGVSGNATADNASITAGSDGNVLRRSGTSIGFGAIALGSSNAVSGTLAMGNGGTGTTNGLHVPRTLYTFNGGSAVSGTGMKSAISGGTAGGSLNPTFVAGDVAWFHGHVQISGAASSPGTMVVTLCAAAISGAACSNTLLTGPTFTLANSMSSNHTVDIVCGINSSSSYTCNGSLDGNISTSASTGWMYPIAVSTTNPATLSPTFDLGFNFSAASANVTLLDLELVVL